VEIESNSGCKLISTIYVNATTPMIFECKCGNRFTTTFKKFSSKQAHKQQCDTCGKEIKSRKLRKSYDDVKEYINGENGNGCILLTLKENFRSSSTLLDIKCRCGHIFHTTYSIFSNNKNPKDKCEECSLKHFQQMQCISYKDIVELFKNSDCTLLTTEQEYIDIKSNKQDVVKYKCSCENISTISISKFKQGHRCVKCANDRKEQTNIERFGYKYTALSPEKLSNMKKTLYENGTAPCSRQQKYLYNLYGGKINYPVKTLSLDIAFPNDKFYIEYDGGLHRGTVIYGNVTDEEFDKKERNRTYGLMRSGWKEMRIISSKDLLPSDSILLNMLSYAKSYLQNHHYIKFDIDNSKLINNQGSFDYDYRELHQIKNTDLQEAS